MRSLIVDWRSVGIPEAVVIDLIDSSGQSTFSPFLQDVKCQFCGMNPFAKLLSKAEHDVR